MSPPSGDIGPSAVLTSVDDNLILFSPTFANRQIFTYQSLKVPSSSHITFGSQHGCYIISYSQRFGAICFGIP